MSETRNRHDTSVMKVSSAHLPQGAKGQKHLASGVQVAIRLWKHAAPADAKPAAAREYETVGYVISGKAELHTEGQIVLLEPGDAWVIPRSATHT